MILISGSRNATSGSTYTAGVNGSSNPLNVIAVFRGKPLPVTISKNADGGWHVTVALPADKKGYLRLFVTDSAGGGGIANKSVRVR